MTPTEALATALWGKDLKDPEAFRLSASILADLDALGFTVARTQDAKDGEALRLLAENVTTGFFMKYDRLFTNVPPSWAVRLPFGGQESTGPTIAAAADACRAAIEATR